MKKVNEDKVLSNCGALRYMWNNKNVVFFMSKLQADYHFRLDCQIVDQHTEEASG